MKKIINFTLIAFLFTSLLFSQATHIMLENPSFEGNPRAGNVPSGWVDCGFPGETPPDILPVSTFRVTRRSFHGATYLGLVVRDVDTWERVGQKLSSPLINGQCYQFSIFLCRSPIYESRSKKTKLPANYVRPVKLIIWGGNQYCAKKEQLADTGLISNYEWKQFNLILKSSRDHTHILLEAFYETPTLFAYNGNLLLDYASPIIPLVNCDSLLSVDSLYKQEIFGEEAFEISATISKEKLDERIMEIHEYLLPNPVQKAKIYINGGDLKKSRNIKRLLKQQLNKLGWRKKDYQILF